MGVRALAALIAALSLLSVGAAAARSASADETALARSGLFTRDRDLSVAERPHPEWAPVGEHLGGFMLLPTLTLGLTGSDNIYAAQTSGSGDAIATLTPAVEAQSLWSRHRLAGFARVSASGFATHPGESTTDYALGASARVDVARDLGVGIGAAVSRETEPRTAPDTAVQAKRPIRFSLARAYAGVAKAFNRLRLSGRAEVRDVAYEDGRTADGALLVQRDRSRTETEAAFRAEYAVSPRASLVANVIGDSRAYRDRLPGELDRSSTGWRAETGVNLELLRLVRGEAAAGWQHRDYGGRFPAVDGPAVRGRVEWFPTQLTTVTLSGERAVAESPTPSAAGVISGTAEGRVDHELFRNVVLTARAAYRDDTYQALDRNDRQTTLAAAVRYLMNRGVVVQARAERITLASSGLAARPGYAVNRVGLDVTLRY